MTRRYQKGVTPNHNARASYSVGSVGLATTASKTPTSALACQSMYLVLDKLRFKFLYKLKNLWYRIKRWIKRWIMPLFSRSSSFRTPRKPPRRNKSVSSIPQLEDSFNFTTDTIGLDTSTVGAAGSLTMKLGDVTLGFNQGNWSVVSAKEGRQSSGGAVKVPRDQSKLEEENNLLRFKVELLIDMLAASNADCLQLQKDLEATKRRQERRT